MALRKRQLPSEVLDAVRRPFARFLRIEAAAAAILVLCVLIAMGLANSPLRDAAEAWWAIPLGVRVGPLVYERSMHHWINDGALTLFFFLVAIELKREWILGELRKSRAAALPVAAAMGGMVVPAALYWLMQRDHEGAHGWGVVMATDTAFVVGCLALVATRIPRSLRVFMLSSAILDDIGAILIVAVGYTHDIVWSGLLYAAIGIGLVRALSFLGVRGFGPYVLCGVGIWISIDAAGIHPTVTGVILGLMTPARRWVDDRRLRSLLAQVVVQPSHLESTRDTPDRSTLQVAEVAARESLSPIERLLILLHPWVALLVMPAFTLANAGVWLGPNVPATSVTWAVFFGLAIGKPLGILLFIWLGVRIRWVRIPPELSPRMLLGGALLGGIGFTMSLLIAAIAFGPPLLDNAKRGILYASLFAAVTGTLVLRWRGTSTRSG